MESELLENPESSLNPKSFRETPGINSMFEPVNADKDNILEGLLTLEDYEAGLACHQIRSDLIEAKKIARGCTLRIDGCLDEYADGINLRCSNINTIDSLFDKTRANASALNMVQMWRDTMIPGPKNTGTYVKSLLIGPDKLEECVNRSANMKLGEELEFDLASFYMRMLNLPAKTTMKYQSP